MKTKTLKSVNLTSSNGDVVIQVKSWYEKPVVWVSIITAVISSLAVVQSYYPGLAIFGVISSVLNIILNTLETTVSNG